jgi:GT2 family glycosyltransferase
MISFILTVYNRQDLLSSFFERMPKQTIEHEWIIVDNGSGAATRQLEYWLQSQYPNVTIISNETNTGFGPANNQGVAHAKYDTLVLTQPDVTFHGDVSKYVGGNLYDYILYGHQLLNYDTGWNRFGDLVVPYLTGYFLACTRPTWNTIGGFDPIYWPADFEDVDLSYTAVLKNITLKQIDVPISHAHFGSTWSQFDDREKYTRVNRARFALKWNLS